MLLHIGTPVLDRDSQLQSPWHALAPKTRILISALLVFAIALTPNGRWLTWAIYGAGLLILVLLSRATIGVLVRRVAVELTFISVVLVGTLFREGGEVLWQWGWLRITSTGLVVLGSVTTKALLSLLMLNLLTLTTAIPDLLQGLAALRLPPLLVAILGSMYRYTAVLADEFLAMRRAALSRNLLGQRRWQRLVIANMFGALFIRTVDRGERVHQAMLARGYAGLPPVASTPASGWRDGLALTIVGGWVLLGQAVYLQLNL